MKLGIIGANGRLGTKVVRKALDRGYQVRSFILEGEGTDKREELIRKSLFDLTKDDLKDLDIVISTFGGGFHADPIINKQAYEQYAKLSAVSGLRIIAIAGAGTLYCGHSHSRREYENMDPAKPLYGISSNICAGIASIRDRTDIHWTAVCPSQKFDFEGAKHGYSIGLDEELLYNSQGESYLSYEDMAEALLDLCDREDLDRKVVTVLSNI